MKHIIITRISFEDDSLFENYLNVSKQTFIPSISNQTNKNFTLGLIIKKKHIDILKSYLPNDIDVKYFNNFDECFNYTKTENYEIQTRHDCDDWMCDTYVEQIQKKCVENKDKYNSFLIQVQPYKLDFNSGIKYRMSLRYTDKTNSMFLSMYQKNCTYSVYKEKHANMNLLAERVFNLNEGMTYLVIHDNNKLSKITKADSIVGETTINKKDISVVVPTFNNVEFIDECLKSILVSSKGLNTEILVGIDACDKTLKYVLKKRKTFDKSIKFFYFKTNVGPYVIKNTLSKISNSNKIIFFDSDDIMEKTMVTKMSNSLNTNSVVRVSYNDFNNNEEITTNLLKLSGKFGEGVFGVRKDVFIKMNGFEPWKCAADSEMSWRLRSNGFKSDMIHQVLFFRRRHGNNLTTRQDTGARSKIRADYAMTIEMKKKLKQNQPLVELPISSYSIITDDGILIDKDMIDNLALFSEELIKERMRVSETVSHVINKEPKEAQFYQELPKEIKKISNGAINDIFKKNYIVLPVKPIENQQIMNVDRHQVNSNRQALIQLKKEENKKRFGR